MGDEGLYLKVTKEVDNGSIDPALWAKAMALTEGDENKAKYKYIKERVDFLSLDSNSITKKVVSEKVIKENNAIEALRKINCTASKNKNAGWTVYKTNDPRKLNEIIEFNDDNEFYSYIEKILPPEEAGIKPDRQSELEDNHSDKQILKDLEQLQSGKQAQVEDNSIERPNYITVSQFAITHSQKEDKVIQLIREGSYDGKLSNGRWYINSNMSRRDNVIGSFVSSLGSFVSSHRGSNIDLPKASKYHLYTILSIALFYALAVTLDIKPGDNPNSIWKYIILGVVIFNVISTFNLSKYLNKNRIMWTSLAIISPMLIYIPSLFLINSANKVFKSNGWKVSLYGGATKIA